ncbi:MAG: hypothetical protein HOV71_04790 [Hamadaea sp.]|nr:hypothetical protein [Hamadaea sp.]NUR47433.1 hypothetical protein [Hamadaea sp.]NUT03412.1 hypothetical protein [Hamadaea sp.]
MSDLAASRRFPDAEVFAIVQLLISLVLVVVAGAASGFQDDDDPWLAGCLVLTQLLPLGVSAGLLLARWSKARPVVVVSVLYAFLVTSFILLATGRYAMLLVLAGWWISILARMPRPGPRTGLEAMRDPAAAPPSAAPGVPPQIWLIVVLEVFLLCVSGLFSVVVYRAIAHDLSGLSSADFLVTLAITGVPFLLADLGSLAGAASLPLTRRWGRAFLLSLTWLRVAFIVVALAGAIVTASDTSDSGERAPVAMCAALFPIVLLVGEAWLVSNPRVRTYLAAEWRIQGPSHVAVVRPAPPGGVPASSPPLPAPPRPPAPE